MTVTDEPTGPTVVPVLTEERDGVLVITLNRPRARNAVGRATAQELAAALDRLEADPALRVGILTGAGGTFSAGTDLKAFARGRVPSWRAGASAVRPGRS